MPSLSLLLLCLASAPGESPLLLDLPMPPPPAGMRMLAPEEKRRLMLAAAPRSSG